MDTEILLPYAYYSEVLQAVSAAVGVGMGIWAVNDARREELFWRGVADKEREIGRSTHITDARYEIASVHFISELFTLVAQIVFLVAGVSGVFLPPPSGPDAAKELLGLAISRYGMAAVTFILSVKSIVRRRGRINYQRARRQTDAGKKVTHDAS